MLLIICKNFYEKNEEIKNPNKNIGIMNFYDLLITGTGRSFVLSNNF